MKKIRRSARMITGMSMASMSDIAFLLIIFFMVTSVFALREGLHLTLPDPSKSPVVVSAKNVAVIGLAADGKISYDGTVVEEEIIALRLAEGMEKNPNLAVLLKIDRRAVYHRAVSVIDAVRRAGIIRLTLRTE